MSRLIGTCKSYALNLLVDLIVRSNVNEDNFLTRFNIDNSYIACNRKCPFASQFSCKWMIIKWVTSLAGQEQAITLFELLDQIRCGFYTFRVMLIKSTVENNPLHSESR